jgi:hypothetical protein
LGVAILLSSIFSANNSKFFLNYRLEMQFGHAPTMSDMKKIAFHLGLVAILMGMLLVGCDDYEDGPAMSFRTKRERAINTWKAEYAYRDDVDASAWYTDWKIDIREDGRILISDLDDRDSVIEQNGFWDFVNDEKEMRFLYSVPAVDPDRKTVTILRLKEKQLWFRDVTDTATWVFHLIPADSTK